MTPSSSPTCYFLNFCFLMGRLVKNHMLFCSHDRDVSEWWCGCMMGLCGVSDWHAMKSLKRNLLVLLHKAPLSSAGHYVRETLASQASSHFAFPLINSLWLLTTVGGKHGAESALLFFFLNLNVAKLLFRNRIV